MSRSVIFRPIAEQDLSEAFGWHSERSMELGDDFLVCVDDAIKIIRDTPELFPIVHKKIRKVIIRHFPYSIYYTTTNVKVYIHAIYHVKRDPNKIIKRS
jgi:toxin ParE1/3/4